MNDKICEICGARFIKNSNSHKYCGDECAGIAKREQNRINTQKWRDKWGVNNKKSLGTGSLGPHPHNDFMLEIEKIRNEKKWIGLIT